MSTPSRRSNTGSPCSPSRYRFIASSIRGVGAEQLRAQRLHHMVAVSLRGRHERLDPPELQALLVVEVRPEEALVGLGELLQRLGIRGVE